MAYSLLWKVRISDFTNICSTLSEVDSGFVELNIHQLFDRSDCARTQHVAAMQCRSRPHSIYSLPKPALALTFSRSVSSAASAMG